MTLLLLFENELSWVTFIVNRCRGPLRGL